MFGYVETATQSHASPLVNPSRKSRSTCTGVGFARSLNLTEVLLWYLLLADGMEK